MSSIDIHEIVDSLLNTTTTKQAYSFGKANHFNNNKNKFDFSFLFL